MCKAKRLGGLGFRDLRIFNLALLAKQCWRLLNQLDTLLGHVLKARYFPNHFFMEASLGSRPSAIRRSILKARPFLAQGIRVRICNGYSTAIWDNSWIPDDSNFRVISPRPDSYFPYKVADLINPITGTWDMDVLDRTFCPIDRSRIMAIPIGEASAEDPVVWHFSKMVVFR